MSAIHYGNPDEVRNLSKLLLTVMKQVRDTNNQGLAIVKKMGGAVNDDAYDRAEEIVIEVTKLIANGIDDVIEVSKKIGEYADFLDSMNQR